MAQDTDMRMQVAVGMCRWCRVMCTVVGVVTLVVATPARAETWSLEAMQQQEASIQYKLAYLADLAEQLQGQPDSPNHDAMESFIKTQVADELQALAELEKKAYRRCEGMNHPDSGNSGNIYKWAEQAKHRKNAIQKMVAWLTSVFGGPATSPEATVVSATTGEAHGAAQDAALEAADALSEGHAWAGVFGKLGTALGVIDGGAKLYQTWRAVEGSVSILDQMQAANTKMMKCTPPPDPTRQQDLGTGPLSPFPPGGPPPTPHHSPTAPKQEAPPKGVTFGQLLRDYVKEHGGKAGGG